MITTKQLIGAGVLGLAAFVMSTSAFAQAEATTSDSGPGLIGKRYLGADFVFTDYRDLEADGFGGGISVNLPVSPAVDIGLSYGYDLLDGDNLEVSSHGLTGGAVWYSQQDGYKPFMSASLGFVQSETEIGTFEDSDGNMVYSVGLGVEAPIGDKTAITGEVSYADGFDSGYEDSIGIEVGLVHWLSNKFALEGSVYVVEDDSITLNIGARFVF
jgi:hypothetical protein